MEKKEAKAAQRAHVMELVEKNDFEGLLKMDELTREVKERAQFLSPKNLRRYFNRIYAQIL
jgi:hypothetical protein